MALFSPPTSICLSSPRHMRLPGLPTYSKPLYPFAFTPTATHISLLGHLQRADASHPRASELVRPDRRVASALPSCVTQPDRRVRCDPSLAQIWARFASARTRTVDVCVLPLTLRAHMAATQMRLDAVGGLAPALCATLKHATASMLELLRRH
jgi:hypothetical protein